MGKQVLAKWRHQPGQFSGPTAHHIAINVHTLPPQDHRLTVSRLMISEAADDEMCEQRAARHHLGQGQIDGGGVPDRFARPAGDTGANMEQEQEYGAGEWGKLQNIAGLGRQLVEAFAHVAPH